MVLAKDAGRKPRELAEAIAEKLRADDLVAKVDIAGPGLHQSDAEPCGLDRGAAQRHRARRSTTARATSARGEPVNVEYVSANPTGPMHVGHCRGAVFGDALANLLAFAGSRGDARILHQRRRRAGRRARALRFLRYREALGEDIGAIPEGFIPAIISSRWARRWPPNTAARSTSKPEAAVAAAGAREGDRHDDGGGPWRPRRAQCQARRVLFRALVDRRRQPTRSPRRSPGCAREARSMKAACRRRKARRSRTGKTANRPCSARPRSATTSTGR